MNKLNFLVLLAAYNGKRWLSEQIESILQQRDVNVTLVISVDYSEDSSFEICKEYACSDPRIQVLPYGNKFGSAGKNFYRLIRDVCFTGYGHVTFCDQDDIWNEDKLINASNLLEQQQADCYSSNVIAFWDDGREQLIDKAQPQCQWDFLFEAAGPGCTYVFKNEVAINFKAWMLERYDKITRDITLHDWLIYAFCRHSSYRWFIDPRPMMRYRQHANNQVGTNNSIIAAKKRLMLIKRKWYRNQITNIAKHLELENISIVKYGLNNGYIGNIYLLFHVNQLRRRLRDRIALSFALFFNIF